MTLRPHRITSAGFSLIELLVVILIISLLLTLGAVGLRGMGGKNVSTAISTSEALFDEARSLAVGKGTKSRVLIDVNDAQNTETYLRRIVVAYQKLNEQGEPTEEWEVSSRPLILPERTFFSMQYSRKEHEGAGGEIEKVTLNTSRESFNGEYLSYEFNSEGICKTPGASFIIGTGARKKGEAPRVTGDGKRDFAGFVVWRNGRTSIFRDIQQMNISGDSSNF